ncbi:MAG TPA: hypothetical protein VE173_06195, partial [Longimicrobiales bacterium]|nr:hypothetical protein [Longimicrobiales bacterium]
AGPRKAAMDAEHRPRRPLLAIVILSPLSTACAAGTATQVEEARRARSTAATAYADLLEDYEGTGVVQADRLVRATDALGSYGPDKYAPFAEVPRGASEVRLQRAHRVS